MCPIKGKLSGWGTFAVQASLRGVCKQVFCAARTRMGMRCISSHMYLYKGGNYMALFKGAGVALVTPMDENLEVDYGKLAEILEDQIKNETDSIIITGTTGEASTLTLEEHLEVIRE